MKVFISSLITGFEPLRAAARAAVKALGHEPVMAEDFPAQANSSQIACLSGVRQSDLVVLVLVGRYGSQLPSGISATHEEYQAAREAKPILLFVQEGVDREPRQESFLREVQDWQAGLFREGFSTAEELRDRITRAIHRYEIAHAAGPADPAALQAEALALIPRIDQRNHSGEAMLHLAIAGGPAQRILRPSELEDPQLADNLHQAALFGAHRIFDRAKGVESRIAGDFLTVEQERGAWVRLSEGGSLALRLPLEPGQGGRRQGFGLMLALIQETVMARLMSSIAYSAWVLGRVDPTNRITHVAVAAGIEASDHLGWRTQAQQDASPNSGIMRMGGTEDLAPVCVARQRAALSFDSQRIAEDLMAPLRRQRGGRAS